MSRKLTSEERVWIIKEFTRTENKREVLRNWPFLTPAPTRSSVRELVNKFNTHGTVKNLKNTGRPRSVLTPLNANIVSASYAMAPNKSVRRAAAELDIHYVSVWRILTIDLNQKAYLPTLVHALKPSDYQERYYHTEHNFPLIS